MHPSAEDNTVVHNLHSDDLNYAYTSGSSTSSSQHSGGFADDDHYGDENGCGYGRRHGASSRSSISSLPGSVVVYPPGKMEPLPFLAHQNDPNMINIAMAKAKAAKYNAYKGRGSKYAAAQGRGRHSPFRHASSVRAMQMGDEAETETETDDGMESLNKGWGRMQMQSPSFSDMSIGSNRSRGSPYHRHHHSHSNSSQRAMTPQQPKEAVQQEAPLVLLHCTLLSPTLSLPQGLGTPSPQLLKDVLPPKYWRRWKLLEDKIAGLDIVRERGVLISHPQDAYDLLEERLLESLDLVKPRLAYGHFLGGEDDIYGREEHVNDDVKPKNVNDHGHGHSCADCGRPVEGHESKWDIKVYAANGLMRAGAWEAAWRGMEKIDVEVGVWLPAEVRRDMENRMIDEKDFKQDTERRLAEDEKRQREVYGGPLDPSQEEIDGLFDHEPQSPYSKRPTSAHAQHSYRPDSTVPLDVPTFSQPDLRTLLWNYLRVLANDPRNAALFFLSILVVYLTMSTGSLETADILVSQPIMQLQPSGSAIMDHATQSSVTVASTPPDLASQGVLTSLFSPEPSTFHELNSAHKAEPGLEPPISQPVDIPEVPLSSLAVQTKLDVIPLPKSESEEVAAEVPPASAHEGQEQEPEEITADAPPIPDHEEQEIESEEVAAEVLPVPTHEDQEPIFTCPDEESVDNDDHDQDHDHDHDHDHDDADADADADANVDVDGDDLPPHEDL